MYLGTLSLRLDFLHYEEACIQKSFNAVDQTALFAPREPRRGRTSDASAAARVYVATDELSEDGVGKKKCVEHDALVPAHGGKRVDGLLDTRLRLLPLKESLQLFL